MPVSGDRSAQGAVSRGRSAQGAVSGGRSAQGTVAGGRSAQGAISGGRSAQGAVSGGRSVQMSVSGGRSAQGAVSGDRSVQMPVSGGRSVQSEGDEVMEVSLTSSLITELGQDFFAAVDQMEQDYIEKGTQHKQSAINQGPHGVQSSSLENLTKQKGTQLKLTAVSHGLRSVPCAANSSVGPAIEQNNMSNVPGNTRIMISPEVENKDTRSPWLSKKMSPCKKTRRRVALSLEGLNSPMERSYSSLSSPLQMSTPLEHSKHLRSRVKNKPGQDSRTIAPTQSRSIFQNILSNNDSQEDMLSDTEDCSVHKPHSRGNNRHPTTTHVVPTSKLRSKTISLKENNPSKSELNTDHHDVEMSDRSAVIRPVSRDHRRSVNTHDRPETLHQPAATLINASSSRTSSESVNIQRKESSPQDASHNTIKANPTCINRQGNK